LAGEPTCLLKVAPFGCSGVGGRRIAEEETDLAVQLQKRLPVVAIKGRRRYWEGCKVAAAARGEVLLPEPTSPVMTVVRLWATA
jgi:hypothetical protein